MTLSAHMPQAAESAYHRAGPCSPVDWSQGASDVFPTRTRWALLGLFAALVVLRLPKAWLNGRLLGEEGAIFLSYAWHNSALPSLLRSFGGYLNIGANVPAVLSARLLQLELIPLELIPYLTMTTGLLFQLVPGVIILSARAPWLASRWAVLASLLMVATSPLTEEVFFNSLHVQFHLALSAALLLAVAPPRSRPGRAAVLFLLFLAPLCGPGAIVLVPFYAARALIDRDRSRAGQAAALALGTALQLFLFFTPSPIRGDFLDPATLSVVMFVRMGILPFTNAPIAQFVGMQVHQAYLAGNGSWWIAVAVSLLYVGLLAWLVWRTRKEPAVWLLAPALVLAAISFGGGMIHVSSGVWFSPQLAQRYNFVPLVLLGLGMVAIAMKPGRGSPLIPVSACIVMIASGAISYPQPLAMLSDGPSWRDEVAAWRQDRSYMPRGWPASWQVDLSDQDRPCLAQLNGKKNDDPEYCESAWITRIVTERSGSLDLSPTQR